MEALGYPGTPDYRLQNVAGDGIVDGARFNGAGKDSGAIPDRSFSASGQDREKHRAQLGSRRYLRGARATMTTRRLLCGRLHALGDLGDRGAAAARLRRLARRKTNGCEGTTSGN